jgi:hypothetical protein
VVSNRAQKYRHFGSNPKDDRSLCLRMSNLFTQAVQKLPLKPINKGKWNAKKNCFFFNEDVKNMYFCVFL